MLTDDDLTKELRAAFRADTDTLSYDGRRRPRRASSALLPLAAAASVAVAAAGAVALSGQAPPTAQPSPVPSATTATSSSVSLMMTETLNLAGYTVRVQHPAGEKIQVRANFRDEVPPGLRMVTLSQPPGRAWVGKDPVTGDMAAFIRVPITNNGHRVFAILAKGATEDLIVDIMNGPPTPVPLTTD